MRSVVQSGALLFHGVGPAERRRRMREEGWFRLRRDWWWTGPEPPGADAHAVALLASVQLPEPTPMTGSPAWLAGTVATKGLPRGPRPGADDPWVQPPLVIGGRLAAELLALELVPAELPTLLVSPPGSAGVRCPTGLRQRRALTRAQVLFRAPSNVVTLDTALGPRPVPWLPVTAPAVLVPDCLPHLDDLQTLWMVEQAQKRFRSDVLTGASRRTASRLAPIVAAADPQSRSPLESGVRRLLVDGGCPAPQVNVKLLPGVVCDLVWAGAKLVVECDGYAWHSAPSVVSKDSQRHRALQRAGWTVLRVTYADLMGNPAGLLADVRAALGL